ncbi:MAG: O-antigen ligase family protein [Candidatus Omnitrophica bacterium]|nr:O-antigen ligase family protein [Candidatus Omnitrophota bacterium]
MDNCIILRKIRLFFIFLFLIWISLYGQTFQLKYDVITLNLIFIIFVLSLLIELPQNFLVMDVILLFYIFIIALGVNFYENKTSVLRHYSLNIFPSYLLYFSFRKIEKEEILTIAFSVSFLSFLITLLGCYEIIFKKNIIYEFWVNNPYYYRFLYRTPRMMSTLIHPTILGSFLAGTVFFVYFIFSIIKKIYKPFIIFIIIFLLTAILFSFSRGVIISFLISTFFYLYLQRKTYYIRFIIIGILILFIFLSIFLKNHPSFYRFSIDYPLLSYCKEIKLENLNILMKILKGHPFFGIGIGNYHMKFKDYITDKQKNIEVLIKQKGYDHAEWHTADNMYISIIAETGILGSLLFFIFLFLLYRRAFSTLKIKENLYHKNIITVCVSGITALLISMNTYDLFYWINPLLLFWFLVGLTRSLLIE